MRQHPWKTAAAVLMLAVLWAVTALAQTEAQFARARLTLPPPEYDHPYSGKLEIHFLPEKEFVTACPSPPGLFRTACTQRYADRCIIRLRPDVDIDKYPFLADVIVVRHEIGHCNGWPPNHPGIRAAEPATWPPMPRARPIITP
jgi:hypothetical protein